MLTKLQNQAKLNNKRKFRQRMVSISNSFVNYNKAHSLRALAPLGFFALLLANVTVCNVSALSISVSSDALSLDLVSGKYGHSEAATIEILSNDALAGYTLTLSGSETLNASKAENGALNKITSEEWTNESSFSDNTWGLKYCNFSDNSDCIVSTNYTQPAETLQIDKTVVNNSQSVKYALSIGAKTSANINADTYSNTFTLAATSNPVYHSVGFVDWTENMPDAIAGTGTSITLPSNVPVKLGYTFKGWCKTKPTNNGTVCSNPATLNEETGKYDLTTTDGVAYTNLYATWEKDTFCDTHLCLQTVNFWKSAIPNDGDIITAYDQRDGKSYQVGRIKKDGYDQIWLLDNLKLAATARDLSSADTNVPSDWPGFKQADNSYSKKLPTSTDTNFNNSEYAMVNSDYEDNYSTSTDSNPSDIAKDVNGGREDWKFGVYYNFCAASAGTYCAPSGHGSGDADYDICPKGWRLPTGGASGEFQTLYSLLGGHSSDPEYDGSGYVEAYADLRNALHLPLSGFFDDSSARNRGSDGLFWTSTFSSTYSMNLLSVSSIKVYPQNFRARSFGLSIRCIAK